MKHLRLLSTAALVSAVALTTAGAPAQAQGEGEGGRGHHGGKHGHGGHGHGGHGPWQVRAGWITLTEEATAILDTASVEVEGSDGARVDRNRDELIVIKLGGGRRHHDDHDSDDRLRGTRGSDRSAATIDFTSLAGTTSWTGFAFDKAERVITADVDGAEDVPVLTLVKIRPDADTSGHGDERRGGSRGWGSSELQLTEESSDALDAVVGTDAFAAGDAFATIGGGGRR
ncbi:hypothetical protein Q9S36_37400 [Microbacterium sp. ARD31]|uniref:hypothetical protein n=1 Tax=Microbacterium sp. ARD31 TaxID=2962576 RepID=UPI002881A945|nr:hypothetical protein [Microbacterium sp. ARD31]MDT0185880.1 hypothetical protein [Microbacterium sp. ARD31]